MSESSPFLNLSLPTLSGLATALETGRLTPPFYAISLSPYVASPWLDRVSQEMNRLIEQGMNVDNIFYLFKMMIAERQKSQHQRDQLNLVWSGLETPGMESRDTQVVVQELFDQAEHKVLIATYAIDQNQKAESLFSKLAQKLDQSPFFQVRLFLNIPRPYGKSVEEAELLQNFAHLFRSNIWPGERLPEVFYDPRSLAPGFGPRACLHAKCIIIDDAKVFITSANFTEAAHKRNLEAGILLNNSEVARAMRNQFESLLKAKLLRLLL